MIELLVVVTIIVVLLALLTPALDKAIYQAELAVCSAQLASIARGSIYYTSSFRRHYPYRYWQWTRGGRPNLLCAGAWDDRPIFKGLMSLDAFNDPFAGKVRFDEGSTGPGPTIYTPRAWFAGWKYRDFKGMLRLGDRFEYKDLDTSGRVNRFNILAADQDQIRSGLAEINSAHPDEEGRMSLYNWQNNYGTTLAFWHTPTLGRGVVDTYNYAADDGSAFGVRKVEVSRNSNGPGDERLKPANISYIDDGPYYFFLPPAP